jgi:hypothetical protein
MNEEKMKELERLNDVYQLGFDDGFNAGMQRAVELNLQDKPALYINEKTLRDGNGGDTFWDTEVSWCAEDGFVPLYEKVKK